MRGPKGPLNPLWDVEILWFVDVEAPRTVAINVDVETEASRFALVCQRGVSAEVKSEVESARQRQHVGTSPVTVGYHRDPREWVEFS